MYARVHLGYSDGVARPTVDGCSPLLGNMLSEHDRGVLVVHLWPYDFPISARHGSAIRPLATLYRPNFTVAGPSAFAITGLERGSRGRWVAQRWHCEPTTYADIRAATLRR